MPDLPGPEANDGAGMHERRYSRHPGLDTILRKLHADGGLSDAEVRELRRHLDDLNDAAHDDGVAVPEHADIVRPQDGELTRGHATLDGGHRRQSAAHGRPDNYRRALDLLVSSIGVGTYRGALDPGTDSAYVETVRAALAAGANLVDTSLNYRDQRSERAVGAAIERFLYDDGGQRDEIIVCTKGGFLVSGAVGPGTVDQVDVAQGAHCISPTFLTDQLSRSRQNLGLETIDVYYIHNPEVQLDSVAPEEFVRRITRAFAALEQAAADGLIRYYGTATWSGYRGGSLSLDELHQVATGLAGNAHHFRFVQLPFNLGMQEAMTSSSQRGRSVLDAASELGVVVITSAPLMQGRLTHGVPVPSVSGDRSWGTDAQRSIQFARSTPGITAVLVGTSNAAHLAENLAVIHLPMLSREEHALFMDVPTPRR